MSKYAEMSSTILEEHKKGGIVSFYNNLKLQKIVVYSFRASARENDFEAKKYRFSI